MIGDAITSLYIDKENNTVWIGTLDSTINDQGLNSFNIDTEQWTVFTREDMNEGASVDPYLINNILINNNESWIATENGLYRYSLLLSMIHYY